METTFASKLDEQRECKGWIERFWENTRKMGQAKLTLPVLKLRQRKLEDYWDSFVQRHHELRRFPEAKTSDYIINDEFSLAESAFFANAGSIVTEIDALTPKPSSKPTQSSVSAETTPTPSPSISSFTHLAKIEIPTFSGDLLSWSNFKGLYESLVHKDTQIPKVLKLQYLKSHLSGEAADLLSNVSISDAGYDGAWKDLLSEYDNNYLLLFRYLRNIVHCPPMTRNVASELKRITSTVKQSTRAFTALGRPVSFWDDWLLFHTVEKLNTSTKLEWQQSLKSSKEIPSFGELLSFLEQRTRALEATFVRDVDISSRSTSSQSMSGNTKKRVTSVHHTSLNDVKRPSVKCPLCKQGHTLGYCANFKRLGPPQRSEQVRKLGVCLNCLHTDHLLAKCSSKFRCSLCNNKHHTLLHLAMTTPNTLPSTSISLSESSSSNFEQAPNSSAKVVNLSARTRGTILLATAQVLLVAPHGKQIVVRALLDTASESSFVTEWVVQRLRLTSNPVHVPISGLQGTNTGVARSQVHLFFRSTQPLAPKRTLHALVMKTLSSCIPSNRVEVGNWTHIKGLRLADPQYFEPGRVDVILGADICGCIFENETRRGPPGTPTAINTMLGWALMGSTHSPASTEEGPPISAFHIQTEDTLSKQLQKFWETEEISRPHPLSPADTFCESLFQTTHYRDLSGRYGVRLPINQEKVQGLGTSRQVALKLFVNNERRLSSNENLKVKYSEFMLEYLRLGHMELIPDPLGSPARTYYLPHHAVMKAHDDQGKIRVVFNASFRTSTGISLNDILFPGPALQSDLWMIITRWRLFRIVFTSDIVKMFRQIMVHTKDQDFQRVLWRTHPSDIAQDFKLTTVTYGMSCAPYLALRVLQQLAEDEQDRFPLGAAIIRNNSYVDDLLTGADTIDEAQEKKKQITDILASGGFALSKWASNSTELCPDGDRDNRHFAELDGISTLGILWNPKLDTFSLRVAKSLELSYPITKRKVLSEVAGFFDPLGWMSPTIIFSKILIQDLWILNLEWDQALPDDMRDKWLQFRVSISEFESFKIPRWVSYTHHPCSLLELHGFSDASDRAFAASVYLRVIDSEQKVHVNLLVAKTRVAPVRTQSIPRLELCGAVLLTKLLDKTRMGLGLESTPVFAWTDSQVVLAWLQSHASKWKPYVAHRVADIQTTLPAPHWRHVPTQENPADLATRGISPTELINSELWWRGPSWLMYSSDSWKQRTQEHRCGNPPEMRATSAFHVALNPGGLELLSKYSNLSRLIVIISLCFRFAQNLRQSKSKMTGFISTEERNRALRSIVKLSQAQAFKGEIACLSKGKPLSSRSNLLALRPFLDNDGILRAGGRLQQSFLTYDEKHPIIIDKACPLAILLVRHAHSTTLHGGPQLTRNYLLRRFWILRGRTLVRSVVRQCVKCARFSGRTGQQLMGQLPAVRTKPSRPFTNSGLDYAGPILLRSSRGRGQKTFKGYVCLFVCLVTKAIHLEVVSDLTSLSFIAAFKRFVSRRGRCVELWSDNATTFRGADSELKAMFKAASSFYQAAAETLSKDGTKWTFIPPHSPHFGGIWEAGIKSTKHHLRRIIGTQSFTFEEMQTLLCEIEACLNSRPISPLSNDPADLIALTPGHFLVGESLISVPEPSHDSLPINPVSRWREISKMKEHFWRRWAAEYLHQLQQRSNWRKEHENLRVGTLVLIKDDLSPPSKWPLARVIQTHPGPDNLVRVATLRTARGTITRPIVKLCALPVMSEGSDITH